MTEQGGAPVIAQTSHTNSFTAKMEAMYCIIVITFSIECTIFELSSKKNRGRK